VCSKRRVAILHIINAIKFLQEKVKKGEEGEEVSPDICSFIVDAVVHGSDGTKRREVWTVAFTDESVELEEVRHLFPCKELVGCC